MIFDGVADDPLGIRKRYGVYRELAGLAYHIVLSWQNILAQAASRLLHPKSRPLAAWERAQRRSVVSKVLIT
jgi:hypothetical protein